MLGFALLASFVFAALYAETAYARSPSLLVAGGIGAGVFVVYALAFLLPPRLFRYTHADGAPHVMSQVIARALVAAAMVVVLNAGVWFVLAGGVALLEELYGYALVAIFLFHGFGGAVASHVVYLQQTRQYNSNQLVAVLALITLILLVLILYLLALDWAIPRDEHVHLRDLTLVTLTLVGYGRAVYLMAHH